MEFRMPGVAALTVLTLMVLPVGAAAQPQLSDPIKGIPYGNPAEEEQLTVWPAASPGATTVVLVHGGGWALQGAETSLTPTARSLQNHDLTVVDVNYPQAGRPGDSAFPRLPNAIVRAVNWARANAARYNGDPSNIVLDGQSAGGQLVAMAAEQVPGEVRAVVLQSAPTNLWALVAMGREGELNPQFGGAVARVLECRALSACSQSFAERWSPVFHPPGASCPAWLIGSDAEDRVPVSQSEELAAALQASGCEVELVVVPKHGHVPQLGDIGAYSFIAAH